MTAACASKVLLKLQLPFCLSDPLFYSTSSNVVFCFPSRCFLALTSWLFDLRHFFFTILSRFFIKSCFHNSMLFQSHVFILQRDAESDFPMESWSCCHGGCCCQTQISRQKTGCLGFFFSKPVALDDLLSQNRLFMMHFSQNR